MINWKWLTKCIEAHLTICAGANRSEGLVPFRHLPHRFVQLQLVKSLRRWRHGCDDQVSSRDPKVLFQDQEVRRVLVLWKVMEIAQCRNKVNWCIDSLRQVDWINWVEASTTATLHNSLCVLLGLSAIFYSLPSLRLKSTAVKAQLDCPSSALPELLLPLPFNMHATLRQKRSI